MTNKTFPEFRVIITHKDEKTGLCNQRSHSAETLSEVKEILVACNITSLSEVMMLQTNLHGQDKVLDLSTLFEVKLTATWKIKK